VATVLAELRYADLARAAEGFPAANRLGRGASCDVFSARLAGRPVAVKRLSADASAGDDRRFTSEMTILTKISHANVCRWLQRLSLTALSL
jgi:hypothetical protein